MGVMLENKYRSCGLDALTQVRRSRLALTARLRFNSPRSAERPLNRVATLGCDFDFYCADVGLSLCGFGRLVLAKPL
jgi:hypothetical protein